MAYPELFLNKNEERRLRQGHQWIFSNEIDHNRCSLAQFLPGDLVNVKDHNGHCLGTAYINPNTLICARLLSRKINLQVNSTFFKLRLKNALAMRQRLFDKPFYRLVFAESDGLPGLVIDRFNHVLSVQITTAGIEKYKQSLVNALVDLFSPEAIVLKSDNQQRKLENLPLETGSIYGRLPEQLVIEENNARFLINIIDGQKTGWFYDHRNNRALLAKLASRQKVLDLFSYSGAWGIQAAMADADQVTCIDSSEAALDLAKSSARLNGVDKKMVFERSDVFEFLQQAREKNEHYDLIILDPPALIKRKKDFKAGYQAYRRLNQLALPLLAKNGILVSASCSYHLSRDNLQEILRSTARHIDRHLVFFASAGQGLDHPITPAMPETEYLKTFFCAVSPSL